MNGTTVHQPDEEALVRLPREAGLPTRSWWLTAPRDGFSRTAAQEADRMRSSRFGRITRLVGNFTETSA